jgi:hypothetical protein
MRQYLSTLSLALILSIAYVLVCGFTLQWMYADDAFSTLNPLSPGIWLADYFDLLRPLGACERKEFTIEEIENRSSLALLCYLGANISIYWVTAYIVLRSRARRQRFKLP